MPKERKLLIFNVLGLILVVVLSVNLYRKITDKTPPDLEHNMKLEVEDFNKNLAGSMISTGVFIENATIEDNNIVVNMTADNKFPDNILNLFVSRICTAFLNGYDIDSQREGILLKISGANYYKTKELYVNIDVCKKIGYRPVTG